MTVPAERFSTSTELVLPPAPRRQTQPLARPRRRCSAARYSPQRSFPVIGQIRLAALQGWLRRQAFPAAIRCASVSTSLIAEVFLIFATVGAAPAGWKADQIVRRLGPVPVAHHGDASHLQRCRACEGIAASPGSRCWRAASAMSSGTHAKPTIPDVALREVALPARRVPQPLRRIHDVVHARWAHARSRRSPGSQRSSGPRRPPRSWIFMDRDGSAAVPMLVNGEALIGSTSR